MRTKIVYVLVSSPKDLYLEQAYISIASLRYHMGNDATVVVIIDNQTELSLNPARRKKLNGADEVITVDLPDSYSPQNRSRILKTSCRKYVKGDFLFVDCDTVITKRLDEIDNYNADIAACYDSHSLFVDNPYREMCIRHSKLLMINIKSERIYFNSGVIYVKDSDKARKFFDLWNKNWLGGRERGVNMDQPAFAKTNIELGHVVSRLPDVWNCQFIHGTRFLKDAKIVHYLFTNNTQQKESFILRNHSVLAEVKKTGVISDDIIACFTDPFTGIPDLTTIVAGEATLFLRSPIYHFFLRKQKNPLFKSLNYIARAADKASSIFKSKKQ